MNNTANSSQTIYRTRIVGCCCALVVMLWGAAGLGQPATRPASTQPTAAATQPVAATQPAGKLPPIPPDEIASKSESALLTVQNIANLPTDPIVQIVDQALPGMISDIDGRAEETAKMLAAHASLETVRNLQSQWEATDKTLADWRSEVFECAKAMKGQNDEISQIESDWQQTLDWTRQRKTRAALGQVASNTVASIERAQLTLQSRWSQTWGVEHRVDAQDARVEENLAAVRQAREQLFSRMLLRDSPPLWSAGGVGQGNGAQWSGNDFSRQVANFRGYIQRHAERLGIHAFVLLIFCGTLVWIRRRLRVRAAGDPELAKAMAVFQRPVATGIVLSFVVSIWIYPDAPQLLRAIIGAVALIPTVIIVRRLIDPRLFGTLNLLVVLFFVDQLRSVLTGQPLVYRLLFLGEMAAITVYIMVLSRQLRLAVGAQTIEKRWSAAHIAARAAVAFFFFAFVANVVGYCGLANFLGDSMLASTYLALILYATTRIAKGLWAFALRAWPLNLLHVVKRHEALMVRRIGLILDWLAGLLWLYESLDLFNIRDVVIEWIRRAMAATLAIGSISLSVGHVLAFAATIWVTFQVSRLARFLLEEDVFDRFDLPSGVPYAISRTLHYVILVWGFCIAVAALGYDMTKFTFLVGAFGVGLGFGMQNIVNNFVSGIILLFERPIKVGDVIQMNDTTGIVEHIGIRASVMQTPEGAEIIVPNGTLISNQVTNWTLSNGRRAVVLPISIAPVPDPNEVIKVLKETAQSHPRVLANPPVQVMVTKISADALGLEIHAWTEGADNWVQLRSELALAIFAAASKHGINLK